MKWIILLSFGFLAACNSASSNKKQQINDVVQSGERSFVSLVYHRFGDERYPSTNISLDNFRTHLEYLKSNKFIVLTLSDALKYLRTEGKNKKVVVITVDDGYSSFLEALPLLKEFGFPATLFVNTETVGNNSYLNWDELLMLTNEGVEIGNHSHSHAYFVDLPHKEQASIFREDLLEAQRLFKEHLNIVPEVFAYPYGEFSPAMKEVVQSLDFTAAAAQNSGVMHNQGDYYALPRFPMADAYAGGFVEKVNMKPLKVDVKPASVIVDEMNPPALKIIFRSDSLDVERLQCFVQGGECSVQVIQRKPFTIAVKSKTMLTRRRTLYTITAPSKNGGWHWYSHLWVVPD